MFSLPDPTLVGVKETLQVAWFEPSDDRLQGLAGVKPPGPSLENVTWPVGLVAPVVAVLVTVAVHDVALLTAIGVEQQIAVVVGPWVAGPVADAPWIVSGRL